MYAMGQSPASRIPEVAMEILLWPRVAILFLCAHAVIAVENSTSTQAAKGTSRKGRLFSVFQVIRFPNDACNASATQSGTCYTSEECVQKGGTNSGSCAQGYGVCCVFSLSCGATSSQNCTFFTSASAPASGQCSLQICPCSSNICQLRLDFNSFVISQPSTSNTVIGSLLNGLVDPQAQKGRTVSQKTQCLLDTFTVTNPGGSAPPVICGTNNNEHMYVDSSDECNKLVFQLGRANTLAGASVATRSWNIKITQYSCDYNNLAPDGCVQYFSGNGGTNVVRTFNFQGGTHLAQQHQSICVRREQGQCRICWSATANSDFQVSGAVTGGTVGSIFCCNYGSTQNAQIGANNKGYDCVTIPGAMNVNKNTKRRADRICGRSQGLRTTSANMQTVCSNQTPFLITFISDNYEVAGGAAGPPETTNSNKGFQLGYTQTAMLCF